MHRKVMVSSSASRAKMYSFTSPPFRWRDTRHLTKARWSNSRSNRDRRAIRLKTSPRQTTKAGAALDDAMKIFQARIRAAGEPAQPGEDTYVDEKNKYTDAEKKFLEVANQYARTRPGQVARYYAALSEEHLKKFDDAEKNLKQLESSGDESLTGLARFQLAWVYTQDNKGPQAVELYKQLTDKPTTFVPKPLVLLALADYYRKTDPAQASKLYKQVKQDFADTPAAEKADQGLELLNAKT